ncbi:ABC-type sugar transport system, ATPase component [Rubidibacter lacunae KORDI 51-2]|uniref:ABC-type sugar transport system, ATPase component n=1 Tax=Rubidibacter lacunae KORDI 51-2 TaxID=582515 RepID=U5DKJ0_9CHRO|nr:ABC transporter ATP-binding protein [Rubidibacter lacunae]ERN40225.1 ABC-type sugar transport system, ATPase component [Rubidibacter lacunae KORDI 51-2]
MAKLELQNVRKEYNSKTVPIKELSIEVDSGEFLTFVGPSGCGKSTTLRLIAGLEEPSRGRVILDGKTINNVPPGDRNIAMVFQSYALYPHMTVAENIASPLRLRKVDASEIQQRINGVVQKLGLDRALLGRKPGQLSGGQRQRVAVARALVRKPEAFLLDEPLSNLDALLREQVRAELKQIFEAQNKPVVYVTHDQVEAMTLSTRIAVLFDGVLQQLATPYEVYNVPANAFVASFMGSPQMNLLTLGCKGDRAILGNAEILLPDLQQKPSRVVLGIRPEDLTLATDEGELTVGGKVFLVEDLGKEKLLSVRLDGDAEKTLRALVPADASHGDDVQLAIASGGLHWFDAESGDRLSQSDSG